MAARHYVRLIVGGVWGAIVFVGLYLRTTSKHGVPTLVSFAWPALFLSLGWNFVQFARRGPDAPPQARVVVPTTRRIKELRAVAQAGSRPQRFRRGDDEPMVDALERLAALHASGALSASEFEAANRRILQGEA